MKLKPEINIKIGGHTDNVGEEDINQTLSQSRANSVMKYLTDHGVPKSRLTASGYGENSPVAYNCKDKGRRLNSKTEVRVW